MSQEPYKLIVCPQGPENRRNSEASVIETKDGRLLLAWWHFYTEDGADHSPGDIGAKWSEDRGRTWGDSFILQENVAGMSTGSPSLLRLQDGRIAFFYGVKNATDDLPFEVVFSQDEARTWSEPVVATPEPGYWVMNNDRAVQLSSGRILCPVCWADDCYHPQEPPWKSTVFYSDDCGKTWRRSKTWLRIDDPSGFQEPGVIELTDGRVLMFGRTAVGHPYRAFSEDGGETWYGLESMANLNAPCSPQSIKRIPETGDLLLVWNNNADESKDHQRRRTPLTVAISRDEGETWENVKDLETDPARTYSYPSILFLGEEVLFTYYDSKALTVGDCSLALALVSLDWLYAS